MNESSPAASFAAHLRDISGRSATALAACHYDGLLLQAGEPPPLFLDDQHYPFHAHPPFKAWVPLADCAGSFVYFEPGRRPKRLAAGRVRGPTTSPAFATVIFRSSSRPLCRP